jgi:phage gp37-like protein
LITRGADFNLEDSEGNRPDDTASHFNAIDSHNVIVGHREQRVQSQSGIAETVSTT